MNRIEGCTPSGETAAKFLGAKKRRSQPCLAWVCLTPRGAVRSAELGAIPARLGNKPATAALRATCGELRRRDRALRRRKLRSIASTVANRAQRGSVRITARFYTTPRSADTDCGARTVD